jgi:hypothetical protein
MEEKYEIEEKLLKKTKNVNNITVPNIITFIG